MSISSALDEADLLQLLKKGDKKAFESLYHLYKERLAVNFIKLLRDDELAKDALQELFIRVWNNRLSIDLNQSFRSYLFRIAQNLAIDYYRKAARDKSMQTLMLQQDNWYQHIEEQLVARENLAILYSILDKLPEKQRRAYILHKVENKSYKEISELMNITPSTINKHIHVAHQFVKEQLIRSPFLFRTILAVWLLAN